MYVICEWGLEKRVWNFSRIFPNWELSIRNLWKFWKDFYPKKIKIFLEQSKFSFGSLLSLGVVNTGLTCIFLLGISCVNTC